MATHPFFQKMANITVGHSRTYFDVAVIPRGYTYEYDLRNPPPLVPLSERNGTAPIFWMQSNCGAKSNRHLIVQELAKYMDIDIYGACLNNKPIPEWATTKYDAGTKRYLDHSHKLNVKRALLEKYPFVLSLENSIDTDYVTEKFWQPLAFGSIPVYLGPANVVDFIPTEHDPDNPLYIDLKDWESLENLAFYLKALAANETMWNRFHKWRQIPQKEREEKSNFLKWLEDQKAIEPLTCAYCKYIHEGREAVKWPVYPPPSISHQSPIHPVIAKSIKP